MRGWLICMGLIAALLLLPANARPVRASTLKVHPAPTAPAVDSCWDCHQEDKQGRRHRASIHFTFGVGCAGCHGGDPTKTRREDAEAEGAGFKGEISVFDIPEVCAKCHGEAENAQWSRLKRNAFEEYKQGFHAEALWGKEEPGAPQCATCHGAHRILRSDDPESPSHPANVNRTCAKCHGDEQYKEDFGLDPEVPARVAKSVHGPRDVWDPERNLPNCASCHGAHWNARPKGKQVFDSCGMCHRPEREAFHAANPHFSKDVHCAKCHGSHAVKPATPALFRDPEVCGACHSPAKNAQDPALEYIDRVLKAAAPVEASLTNARATLARLRKAGFDPEDGASRLGRARRALLTRFGQVQHRLHLVKNFKALEAVGEQAKAAEASLLAARRGHRWTRIALWVGAAYLIFWGALLWRRMSRNQSFYR